MVDTQLLAEAYTTIFKDAQKKISCISRGQFSM